ncbi:uncharacterized protein LOC130591089 [Beta vulgaris subsp. vulgaris]|uniref:uncharacterized protein LOC130591089 n=1 Tax=Beta vulgaris subsp. vulgaris TaxID=3555 RepID=UPI0025479D7D|nr:uncharacterized protein LOC130591089 [Beta vulgaris subsp. vulgaris]
MEYGCIHLYLEHQYEIDLNGFNVNVPFMSLLNASTFIENTKANDNMVNDDIDYDENGSDLEDVEVMEARDRIKHYKKLENELEEELDYLKRVAARRGNDKLNVGSDVEASDSSGFNSTYEESDEDDVGFLVPPPSNKSSKLHNISYKPGTTPQNTYFSVGMDFLNANQFKKALSDYCVNNGKDVKFTKNHKDRVGAKCKATGCEWSIWASWDGKKKTFRVKTYNGAHNCGRTQKSKKISRRWIANHYHNKFKINPYWKMQEIVDTIWNEWGLKISIKMAHNARKEAQKMVLGEYQEQFKLLPRYAAEILSSNPNNNVKFKLEGGQFKAMYLCFDALKQGFLNGCRPIISLDGCFLKGPYGGQLLVAVGRDGNNQFFPVAWAIVDIENGVNWTWFLSLLAADLKTTRGAGYTFMSDQQKGLINSIDEIFPEAEKRCCARHVYCNFREKFGGGKEYRKHFWRIAKSTTENEFKERVADFGNLNEAAAQDLLNRNYKKWCRAFYSPLSKCDSVDNNMSEVFNAYILNSRHKPIITMLEDIREGLMERLHKKRDMFNGKQWFLCPRIQQKLETSKVHARGWAAYWDGRFSFGVREGATQVKYVVNLLNRTCSCNAWQVSGIPCNHVVAAIWKNGDPPEQYVADWFHKCNYLKAYQFNLEPLSGPQVWPTSQYSIQPPPVKKVNACRPKKKRRLQAGEIVRGRKISKVGSEMSCTKCGQQGHNIRTCKNDQDILNFAPSKNQKQQQTKPQQRKGRQEQGFENSSLPTQHSHVPMHQTGIGIYTYPNGFQRLATVQPLRGGVAVYNDNEGHNTLHSITSNHETVPDMSQSNNTRAPWFSASTSKYYYQGGGLDYNI